MILFGRVWFGSRECVCSCLFFVALASIVLISKYHQHCVISCEKYYNNVTLSSVVWHVVVFACCSCWYACVYSCDWCCLLS